VGLALSVTLTMTIAAWCCLQPVAALDDLSVEVTRDAGRYFIRAEGTVAASRPRVHALLTDYDRLTRLHETILVSRTLEPSASSAARVHIETRTCVLVFCFDVAQRTVYESRGQSEIAARVEPQHSDLAFGWYYWRLEALPGGGTRIAFRAAVEPSFWIPPVIGPWVLKRELRVLFTGIAENLERLAAEGREPHPDAHSIPRSGSPSSSRRFSASAVMCSHSTTSSGRCIRPSGPGDESCACRTAIRLRRSQASIMFVSARMRRRCASGSSRSSFGNSNMMLVSTRFWRRNTCSA